MVSNGTVARAFANGNSAKTVNMSTDGNKCWSYSTVIACKLNDNTCLMSMNTYSNSTAKHINHVKYYLNSNIDIIQVPTNYGMTILDEKQVKDKFTRWINMYLNDKKLLNRKPYRIDFRNIVENAFKYDKQVSKFIDDKFRVQITRTLNSMKKD